VSRRRRVCNGAFILGPRVGDSLEVRLVLSQPYIHPGGALSMMGRRCQHERVLAVSPSWIFFSDLHEVWLLAEPPGGWTGRMVRWAREEQVRQEDGGSDRYVQA
jgi:hypothetical protein